MKNKEPIFFLQDIQNSVEKIFKYTKDKLPQFSNEIVKLIEGFNLE